MVTSRTRWGGKVSFSVGFFYFALSLLVLPWGVCYSRDSCGAILGTADLLMKTYFVKPRSCLWYYQDYWVHWPSLLIKKRTIMIITMIIILFCKRIFSNLNALQPCSVKSLWNRAGIYCQVNRFQRVSEVLTEYNTWNSWFPVKQHEFCTTNICVYWKHKKLALEY